VFGDVFRCAINATPKQWSKWLSFAKLWYNSAYHSIIKCSPFKALYGTKPYMEIVPTPISVGKSKVVVTLEERQHFPKLLKEQLVRAQNRMKLDADTRRSARQFQLGEC
jgi:hypothetical protein